MLNRSPRDVPPTLALTASESACSIASSKKQEQKTLSHYLINIAPLGGYLALARDPPSGNTVMYAGCHASPISRWAPCRRRICG